MTADDEINQFKSQIADLSCLARLFEHVPDVVFFTKDRQCRLMFGNANLLTLLRQPSFATVVGRTGYDFFPKGIADGFEADDQQVMAGAGHPILDRIELIITETGEVCWFATSKYPLYGHDGQVVGLMGITRNVSYADDRLHPFARMMPVIDVMRASFSTEIDMPAMARMVGLSPSQFRRTFKTMFHTAPLQFVQRLRIQHAANLLRTTRLNVGEVADRCGFEDQSYFARQFRKHMGVTPRDYQQRQAEVSAGPTATADRRTDPAARPR